MRYASCACRPALRQSRVRAAHGTGIFAQPHLPHLVLQGSSGVNRVGILVGGLGSIAAVRLLRSMLFNVAPFDPISFAGAAIVLVMTVLIAGAAPARRAASIEPMQALRNE